MKLRLFHKFFFAFLAVGIVVVVIAGFLIEQELRTDLTALIDDEIAAEARIIALMPAGEIARRVGELAERARARVTLIDATGRVTADSERDNREMDNHLDRPEIQDAGMKGVGKAVRFSLTLKKDMLYVAVPLRAGSQTTGYIRLSRPLTEISLATHGMGNRFHYYFGYRRCLPDNRLGVFPEDALPHPQIGGVRRDRSAREMSWSAADRLPG